VVTFVAAFGSDDLSRPVTIAGSKQAGFQRPVKQLDKAPTVATALDKITWRQSTC
jgi:hypothetical protein